jgi:hypothetical protein
MGLCQLHQLRNRDFGSACAIGFWIESNSSKPKPVKVCDEQQERVMIDEPHLSVAGLAWRHVVGYGRRLRKRERANAVFRRRRSAFNGHKNPKRKANWRDSAHSESTQAARLPIARGTRRTTKRLYTAYLARRPIANIWPHLNADNSARSLSRIGLIVECARGAKNKDAQ